MTGPWLPWMVIVPEYQRVAVFRLGRIVGYRGPGVVWRMPLLEQFQLVDSRIVTVDVQPQEAGNTVVFADPAQATTAVAAADLHRRSARGAETGG